MISLQIQGLEKAVNDALKGVVRTRAGIDRGLKEAGFFVKAESQKRTPVDTGFLKASHYVKGPTGSKTRREIEVGATAKYAEHVHNDLEAKHTNGQAMFLKRGFEDNYPTVLGFMIRNAKAG